MIEIVTHDGVFHADEVLAVSLIRAFNLEKIKVTRVPHQTTDFDAYDLVIDIGMKYDGIKHFDHHHDECLPSAAGLVWKSLDLIYPTVDELVALVSEFDTGLKKCNKFEYPRLVTNLNHREPHNAEAQGEAFLQAVSFTTAMIYNMVDYDEAKFETRRIVENAKVINGILELPEYRKGWTDFINGEIRPDVKRVVWYEKNKDVWYVQVPAMSKTTYDLNGPRLSPSELCIFVHANGFLATTATRDLMFKYLSEEG